MALKLATVEHNMLCILIDIDKEVAVKADEFGNVVLYYQKA